MKNISKFYLTVLLILIVSMTFSKDIEIVGSIVNKNLTLSSSIDYHLTDANNVLVNSVVDIESEEAWLFFDQIKPSAVLQKYKDQIRVNGNPIVPFKNCRLVVYKQGSVLIPHPTEYNPLTTYTDNNYGGQSNNYLIDQYYTNSPIDDIPSVRIESLTHDNAVRSFRLKRGYMVTFANEPDGMGYSRCFIADREDMEVPVLPDELSGKISFIRVFPWEWPSKKGWVGTYWSSQAEGLKYVDQQADLTNSTWYYSWGASVYGSKNATDSTLINQEFVPEKWGKGGSTSPFYTNKRWSHLIGQNEPDHAEQSNVTVEEAISEWPALIKTGARLGTPATTDYSWLYEFMAECELRNYRVDFVVVHAYWEGMSPSGWYNALKKIHEKTGRPLWIKEWNNGANWTNESWPDGSKGDHPYTDKNAAKQLTDLIGILQVMDTTSFIERYSIYNWVEDARAIILNNSLTKAGEYYALNRPKLAFDPSNQVIPKWIMTAPSLTSMFDLQNEEIQLSWTDPNGELTQHYIIEQSLDNAHWTKIDEINSSYINSYKTKALSADESPESYVLCRVKAVGLDGNATLSNVIRYSFAKKKTDNSIISSRVNLKSDWSMFFIPDLQVVNPVCIAGPSTYRNRVPLVVRGRNIGSNSFELQLGTYEYSGVTSFYSPDTVSVMYVEKGMQEYGDISIYADTLQNVSKVWRKVRFHKAFDQVPVVLATQITNNDPTVSAIRIKNVSLTGFDVCRKYESGKNNVLEDVSFVALTPGIAMFDDKSSIEVGRISDGKGVSYSNPTRIEFERSYDDPDFFAFMQTSNDEVAAGLRLKTIRSEYSEVFKDKEKSSSSITPDSEEIGWVVIGKESYTGIDGISYKKYDYVYDSQCMVLLHIGGGMIAEVSIFSLTGCKLIEASNKNRIELSNLSPGIYIIIINQSFFDKIIIT